MSDSAFFGRDVILTKSGQPVFAGIVSKTISNEATAPDITDENDDGYATYLPEATRKGLTLSIEGFTRDPKLITALAAGVVELADCELDIDGKGEFSGDFILEGISVELPENEVSGFSATLKSSGEYQFENEDT